MNSSLVNPLKVCIIAFAFSSSPSKHIQCDVYSFNLLFSSNNSTGTVIVSHFFPKYSSSNLLLTTNTWIKSKRVNISNEEPDNVYYVHHGAKIRYMNPLYKGKRIYDECKIAKRYIDNNLSYSMDNYVYIDNINF